LPNFSEKALPNFSEKALPNFSFEQEFCLGIIHPFEEIYSTKLKRLWTVDLSIFFP